MHSRDQRKETGPLSEEFWAEFERTIRAAARAEVSFVGFVFPESDFSDRKFSCGCNFMSASFVGDANFKGATFSQGVSFGGAKFTGEVNFYGATFKGSAEFDSAVFSMPANFNMAVFSDQASFGDVSFNEAALFDSRFQGDAWFFRAAFANDADFGGAVFLGNAYFNDASFGMGASFFGGEFDGLVEFDHTEFKSSTTWERRKFLGRADFTGTRFNSPDRSEPAAVFSLAEFSKPGQIVFDDLDLGNVQFQNCDVSEIWFTSSARWGKRNGRFGCTVFEESILLPDLPASALGDSPPTAFCEVQQIYQQLKKNYDSRLDYRTANEFHFSEMEMKRLEPPKRGRLFGMRRWFQRNLSLVALYRTASDYGNNYVKPLVWLLSVLAMSAALFPAPGAGLKQQRSEIVKTYSNAWLGNETWADNLWTEAKLLGASAVTSVDTATFQRNPEFTPAFPWGRVLAIAETLSTSTLLGLFLLAIRRQFRR